MSPLTDPTIHFTEPPEPLRSPVLLVAVRAAGAHTPGATMDLFDQYQPHPLAEIDPDEFYDFTASRPLAHTVDGQREIAWPRTQFSCVPLPDHDLVLLSIVEPGLRWQRFVGLMVDICRAYGIGEAILLSSFAGGTPHTRPIPLRWVVGSHDTPNRFGTTPTPPRYHGPASFVMALGAMLRDAGLRVGTLNVIAPFYLGIDPSPHAVRALADALASEFNLTFDLEALTHQIGEVESQAVIQMQDSDQLRTFLADLEQQYDAARGIDSNGQPGGQAAQEPDGGELPATDDLLADIEAMLRASGGSDTDADAEADGGAGVDPDPGEPGGSRSA